VLPGSELSGVAAWVPWRVGFRASGHVTSSSPPPRTASLLFPVQNKDYKNMSTHKSFYSRIEFCLHHWFCYFPV